MSSYISETLLQELLVDDRLALRSLEVEGMDLDMTVIGLKAAVLKAAHTSLAYADTKCFSTLRKLPWSLSRGDLATNVQQLISRPGPPDHPVAAQIWHLGSLGLPGRASLKATPLSHTGFRINLVSQ